MLASEESWLDEREGPCRASLQLNGYMLYLLKGSRIRWDLGFRDELLTKIGSAKETRLSVVETFV